MEIIGTVKELPPRAGGARLKGQYHADVMEIITAIGASDPGEMVVAEFETDKLAAVRALTLRKAGYAASTRGSKVYACIPEDEVAEAAPE